MYILHYQVSLHEIMLWSKHHIRTNKGTYKLLNLILFYAVDVKVKHGLQTKLCFHNDDNLCLMWMYNYHYVNVKNKLWSKFIRDNEIHTVLAAICIREVPHF